MNGINHSSVSKSLLNSSKLLSKFSAANNNAYVLQSVHDVNGENLAVELSNCTIQVYGPNGDLLSVFAHDKEVSNVKFSSIDPFLLMSSSIDGKLNVWDLRCQQAVQTYFDNSDGTLKPLTCFDYNLEETFLCAGTELIREDSFLLFWDKRSPTVLGGYWNSHTDDITQVHFNPKENSCMASSSTDGLINVFDLKETSEDEALQYTLNIGSGIANFCWRGVKHISCTTSVEEYQLWSIFEGFPAVTTTRKELSKDYQIQVDYLINSLQIDNAWFLATGSFNGLIYLWESKKNGLNPKYLLSGGHSDVVRSIYYSTKDKSIVSGGEDGVVCKWMLFST